MGKAPGSPAAPHAASILRSPTAKSKKPGQQPAQDARLSQTAPLTQAEESSDSSSSSDSDKETSKQPPKPGQFSQEDALSAVGQARMGQFFVPLWEMCLLHISGWRVISTPALQRAPLWREKACWWQSSCVG